MNFLQNAPSPVSSTSPALANPPKVTSTTAKNGAPTFMSEDTRTLLDGCGLNIPASLSITLTAPKTPTVSIEQIPGIRTTNDVTRQNPTITLNDKSVDPKVLKALKAGQMRVPAVTPKNKGKHKIQSSDTASQPTKKKKEEMLPPPPPPSPQNILDLSGNKRMDIPLKIPIPVGKPKVKPHNWVSYFYSVS